MDALVEASDRLAQPLLQKPPLTGRPEFNHLDLRPGLLKEEPLLKLVDNGSTVPLVVQLMSPNIHLHSTTLIYKRAEEPNAPTFRRGWHRDIRIPRDLGHENLLLPDRLSRAEQRDDFDGARQSSKTDRAGAA